MSLFEGSAPPDITRTTTTAAQAPQYLTDYLTQLAQTGQGLMGTAQVAPQSGLQQKAYEVAPAALASFQPAMTSALEAGQAAAGPITQADISAFYNPYESQVVDEMSRQSALNVQRNLLPQLRSQFAGTGGFGSQRYAGATGQALADVQADLLGQQAKYRAAGYQGALEAALRQRAGQTAAAQALSNIGGTQQAAVTSGLKSLADLGGQQQAYEQAKIEAPLVRAQNVAQLMRGYTYPTTTTETYKGPANIYQPSPLAQIAGLGSLLGSGFSSQSGWGNKLFDLVGKVFSGTTGDGGLTYNPGAGYGTGTTSTGQNIYDQSNYVYDPLGP